MPNVMPPDDHSADIIDRLNAACVGHPHARISWPHRLLHDARAEIERLRTQRDRMLKRLQSAGLSTPIDGEIMNGDEQRHG